MQKRNFRLVTFSLLFAGLGLMIVAILVGEGQTRTILLSCTGAFYLAAAVQIVIYRMKPKAFDEKRGMNESNNGRTH